MSREWRNLALADAKNQDLYGFGGWLLVMYGLAVFLLAWQLFGAFNPDQDGLAQMYGSPANAAIMRVVLIVKALSWIPFLVLAPLRSRLMVPVALACILATFLLDAVVVNVSLGLPAAKAMGVNTFNVVIAAAYTLYLLKSKRVNLTYRLRERAA